MASVSRAGGPLPCRRVGPAGGEVRQPNVRGCGSQGRVVDRAYASEDEWWHGVHAPGAVRPFGEQDRARDMDFGYLLDESSSFDVMDAAVDAGINHFDTADVYGGPQAADMTKGYGVSEEVIGRWLQRSGGRDDIVLATKVYQPMGLGPNDRRLSAYHLRRACEASLRRLQTDHIDLYQMHHVDRATPWGGDLAGDGA